MLENSAWDRNFAVLINERRRPRESKGSKSEGHVMAAGNT
jgi:hypothetical protein